MDTCAIIELSGDRRTALEWHLTANHYPSLPIELVDTAEEAIENALDDDWDRLVPLPDGISWRDQDAAPTSACIDEWHLEPFLVD